MLCLELVMSEGISVVRGRQFLESAVDRSSLALHPVLAVVLPGNVTCAVCDHILRVGLRFFLLVRAIVELSMQLTRIEFSQELLYFAWDLGVGVLWEEVHMSKAVDSNQRKVILAFALKKGSLMKTIP